MINASAILHLVTQALAIVDRVHKDHGAEKALEELKKLEAIMSAVKRGDLKLLDVPKAKAELDALIERVASLDEIKKGEQTADDALAKKFDTGGDK